MFQTKVMQFAETCVGNILSDKTSHWKYPQCYMHLRCRCHHQHSPHEGDPPDFKWKSWGKGEVDVPDVQQGRERQHWRKRDEWVRNFVYIRKVGFFFFKWWKSRTNVNGSVIQSFMFIWFQWFKLMIGQGDPGMLPDAWGGLPWQSWGHVQHDGQVGVPHTDPYSWMLFLLRDGDGTITEQEFIRACLEDVELSRLLSIRT